MHAGGIELLVLLSGTLLGLLLFLRLQSSRLGLMAFAAIFLAALATAGVVAWQRTPPQAEVEIANRPIQVRENGYVSSQTCKACHPREYASWYGSYHRTMTQVAGPQSVIGEFHGQDLYAHGQRYRLERAGDEYFVELDNPDAVPGGPARVKWPIVMTTGSHHMQAYWYATGDRREVGILPLVYLADDKKWILERASYLKPPLLKPHDSRGLWNWACQQCHSTAPQPRKEQMDTQVAELGIACEACHGPCEEHVRENQDPRRRYDLHNSGKPDPTVVNPAHLAADRASEVCGQCHGIWEASDVEESKRSEDSGFTYRPGQELAKSKFTLHGQALQGERMRNILGSDKHFLDDRYWPDGMIRVAGREHVGLVDSPCHAHGDPARPRMTCFHCHAMHQSRDDPRPLKEWANDQLKPGMDGNEACLQCHENLRSRLEEHTHHKAGSSGSLCYNCHMPHTAYALLKAIRNHTVDTPSVAASKNAGRPNACNQCHLDKTMAWTTDHLQEWYGIAKPELTDDEKQFSASLLWLLSGDAGQRALAAWCMGWSAAQGASGAEWMIPHLAPLLLDPYDAVRYIAYRSLRTLPGCGKIEYDFLGLEAQRDKAFKQALGIWRNLGTARRTGPEILITESRDLDRDNWSRILEKRDDRRVNLEE